LYVRQRLYKAVNTAKHREINGQDPPIHAFWDCPVFLTQRKSPPRSSNRGVTKPLRAYGFFASRRRFT